MSGVFGGRQSSGSSITAETGFRVQTSLYGLPIALMWGTVRAPVNLVWFDDFKAEPQTTSAGGKGGGGKTVSGYSYTTALAMAIGEGPIQAVPRVWVSKEVGTLATFGLTLFNGAAGQTPWGYLTTFHPGQDLVYPGLAYVASGSYALGSSPDLSNHNVEVKALYGGDEQPDANPRDVLLDFLTNARYGVPGFTSAMLDGLDAYSAYCAAQGLLVSPLWTEQKPAIEYVRHLLDITNTDAVPSQGKLRLIPRVDQSYTFTVDAAELLAPVKRTTTDPDQTTDDACNVVRIECLDRANSYNADTVTASDGVNISIYGRRELGTVTAREFCTLGSAQVAAQLKLQRVLFVRQRYEIKLGVQRVLHEPGDVGTVPYRGRDIPVRITEVQRDGELVTWRAEEYVAGGGDASDVNGSGGGSGYGADYGAAPGPTLTPLFIDAPSWLTGGQAQMWMAVSGTGNWGGVSVHVSLDGTTYRRVGSTRLKAIYGTLQAALPAPSADPDVTNVLDVLLADSSLDLPAATDDAAQGNQVLSLVDGELICHVNSTLVSAGRYQLDRLYRGRKGSATAAHASGAPYVRVNGAIFRYTYDQALVSGTVYIKLTAFNVYGAAEQSLADVSAYTVTLTPLAPPPGTPDDYFDWSTLGGA